MARPKKNTVDYFPHTVTHGKTLFIIEERFGNDGYAFWFKLLEILGNTQDHVFRAGNPEEWMFLLAKTHVCGDIATQILDALASLNAIDRELWQEKTIWVQNFVNGVADVYTRRKTETPVKPSLCQQKPCAPGITVDENRQSKVKESKVKESRLSPVVATTEKISENRHIYHLIESAFLKKNQEFNFKREAPHIKRLEEKCLAREPPEEFTRTLLVTFWKLTHSKEKLFKDKPFLPSILNSGGLYPYVLKAMENQELDDWDIVEVF